MRWCAAGEGLARKWVTTALALVAFACGKDALVGGSCRKGLTECNLQCVDTSQNQAHCGACGHACSSGQACSAGACSSAITDAGGDAVTPDGGEDDVSGSDAAPDASLPDGRFDVSLSDAQRDVGVTDGRLDVVAPDGRADDVGVPDGRVDDVGAPDGSTCTPPYDTPERCGDCFTSCVAPTPLCGLQQGTFKCVARCDPPLIDCGAICINTASDETNCGTCGLVCPSGICQAGACVGKGYGHEIVIGADYADSTLAESSAQVTMLGNAVFQSVATMVRILAYDEFADRATVARIESWLMAMAAARGKSVTISKPSDWTAVPQRLTVAEYQAFLVYDQALAPNHQMATTGTLWNAAMSAFAKGGGIIVALDGGSAGRMIDFLNNGGLLEVSGETDVTGTQLSVDAPTDVVGLNLPNVFAAKRSTVAFSTTQVRDNYHVFVVTDSTGMLPVVVHSVPRP
jgi:hypothetical protein